jgi:hypothetical protein
MTKQLIGLFEDFGRRVDLKIQPEGFPHTKIKLNSLGGSVPAAMAIGRLLRKYRMLARVTPSSVCISACVLVYAGAVTRHGHFNAGKVGIHQPYLDFPIQQKIDPETIKNAYESVLRDIRAYFREMNVSEQLADEMLKVPPTSVRYLSDKEQDQFGLVTTDPVEHEVSDVEQAQELGVTRTELMRRQMLLMKDCYTLYAGGMNSSNCEHEVMRTGKVPD